MVEHHHIVHAHSLTSTTIDIDIIIIIIAWTRSILQQANRLFQTTSTIQIVSNSVCSVGRIEMNKPTYGWPVLRWYDEMRHSSTAHFYDHRLCTFISHACLFFFWFRLSLLIFRSGPDSNLVDAGHEFEMIPRAHFSHRFIVELIFIRWTEWCWFNEDCPSSFCVNFVFGFHCLPLFCLSCQMSDDAPFHLVLLTSIVLLACFPLEFRKGLS